LFLNEKQAASRSAGSSRTRAEIRLRRPQKQKARIPLPVDCPHQRGLPRSRNFVQQVSARREGRRSRPEPQGSRRRGPARRRCVPRARRIRQGSAGESMSPVEQESDSLSSLEERIQQAVELVTRLRRERDAAVSEAAESKAELDRLSGEVKSLQAERKQVRARIEKLLGQIDQLNA